MAVIGTFTPAKDGGWIGNIHTLTISARIRFVPNDNRKTDSAPAYRIFTGSSRIGEAWSERSSGQNPKDYLRVRLEDPALLEPLNAALFPSDDGATAQLVWTRRPPAQGPG